MRGTAPVRRDVPIRRRRAVGRLQRALVQSASVDRPRPAQRERQVVELDLAAAHAIVVARTDPRTTVPRRLGTLLTAGPDRPLVDGAPERAERPACSGSRDGGP